jgi:type II secretory pathway pseudopilin PulG
MRKENRNASGSGFTLTEVMIYVAVLAVVGMALVSVVLASTRSTEEHDTIVKVEERNRTAIIRIEREIRRSIAGTLVLGGFDRSIAFTAAAGFDGTSVVPGETVTFTFELANGEALNGVDDNGNGMADEGQLRRSDSTGTSHLICGGIDVQNSGFAVNGIGITITVSSYGAMRTGAPFSLTKTTSVFPRN